MVIIRAASAGCTGHVSRLLRMKCVIGSVWFWEGAAVARLKFLFNSSFSIRTRYSAFSLWPFVRSLKIVVRKVKRFLRIRVCRYHALSFGCLPTFRSIVVPLSSRRLKIKSPQSFDTPERSLIDVFPNLIIVLKLYVTLPITCCEIERSFYKLPVVISCLRVMAELSFESVCRMYYKRIVIRRGDQKNMAAIKM